MHPPKPNTSQNRLYVSSGLSDHVLPDTLTPGPTVPLSEDVAFLKSFLEDDEKPQNSPVSDSEIAFLSSVFQTSDGLLDFNALKKACC